MADNGGKERLSPQVSVIIPCYNAQNTLQLAVDSALCQDEDIPLEVLIIDDQSTDRTAQVLQRYREDARVRVLRADHHLGAAGGRNLGVQEAAGAYIAFLDADDIWQKGKLKKQMDRLTESGAKICCTGRELLDPSGRRTGRIIGVKEHITYRDELRTNQINCSSVLMPREIALAAPMEHEDSHEDYITWLRILKEGGFAVGIDEPLLLYRLTTKGKSGNKLKSARMTYRAYRYSGLGRVRASVSFILYAVNGAGKYLCSHFRKG